jgi:hypothetical protein
MSALLAGVFVVFISVATPVAAQTSAPTTEKQNATSAPVSVPADAVGLSLAQVTGSGLAVTLDPGASEEHDLVISNHTANLRLTIKLTATDATGNLGSAASSWLAFGDDAVQLDPHAAVTVPMTVAVPHDTQPASALAHVSATVESAVAAADGSPVSGTARQTFPVSIIVQGTPTAQIAIADVRRIDEGSRHQLAVVLRNFGVQGAEVSGHVVVAGDKPQTLPFHANLEASRDTTVKLGWNAPKVGTASDIAVDLEYGSGNVASWSSRLGGAPTDLTPSTIASPTPTSPVASDTSATSSSASAGPAKPWWKQPIVTFLAIVALLGAALWFGFEMRSSSRRREWVPVPGRSLGPPGWAPGPSDESIDLAKQLVRLTDVVVQLVETHRDSQDIMGERPRARSPNPEPSDEPLGVVHRSPFENDAQQSARAGPAPPGPSWDAADSPDPDPPVQPALPFPEQPLEVVRSASPTPGASSRPEPVAPVIIPPVSAAPFAFVNPPVEAVVQPVAPEPVVDEPEVVAHVVDVPLVAAVHELLAEEPVVEEPVVEEPVVEEPAVEPAVAPVVEEAVVASAPDAAQAAMIERLMDLDRQRRRLREWMDAEEVDETIEPPGFGFFAHFDAPERGDDQ